MKIVILDASTLGSDISLDRFSELGEVEIFDTTTREEAFERIANADVIITNKVLMDKEAIDHAPNLKLIALTATGYNNVDIAYCKEKGIAVTNVAGYSTESVAQHTFAMLMYLYSSMSYYDFYVKTGEYTKSPIFTHLQMPWHELDGKTWGIIGLGAIGKAVAKKAEAFGCKVIYYSTSGANKNADYKEVALDELLSESDIVSVHCPLNEKTKDLIGFEEMKKMKSTAILLNLGRGGIVNEAGIVKALNSDEIAGVCLDVLEKEPLDKESIFNLVIEQHKLLITPHIAWASVEARARLVDEVYKNLVAFSNNERRNRID